MNFNYPDPGLTEVVIPSDFLSKVYLARCSFNYSNSCSGPEGQISDFNIWDRALSQKEAEDWTTCRKDKDVIDLYKYSVYWVSNKVPS